MAQGPNFSDMLDGKVNQTDPMPYTSTPRRPSLAFESKAICGT